MNVILWSLGRSIYWVLWSITYRIAVGSSSASNCAHWADEMLAEYDKRWNNAKAGS